MDRLTTPLRSREAAALLGVSTRTLRRYISDGVVPIYRLPSGHVRVHPDVIEELTRPVGSQNEHLIIKRGWRERPGRKGAQRSRARRPSLGSDERAVFFDTSPVALDLLHAQCPQAP